MIILSTRRCEYCRRKYAYNPSVGKFGTICPYCGRPQKNLLPVKKPFSMLNEKEDRSLRLRSV